MCAFICLRRLPQISIIDGRKYDTEGDGEDVLERCELLCNKQGQPLLAHGRSGRCVQALAGGVFMRGPCVSRGAAPYQAALPITCIRLVSVLAQRCCRCRHATPLPYQPSLCRLPTMLCCMRVHTL